ncbi:MAG: esterase-like activity of phytase family protein [Defluviicoccus sp.]|nr:MAG: esterase-like activity of phytase family protein [Defluviicoccus sp.]
MFKRNVVGWLAAAIIVVLDPLSASVAAAADSIVVTTRPAALNAYSPETTRTGRLEYRGGLVLRSTDKRFGGLSGMLVSPDGAWLVAVSDRGWRVRMRLQYDASGQLVGVSDATLDPLRGITVPWLANRPAGDAESLARGSQEGVPDGDMIIAFETRPKLWRYPAGDGAPVPLAIPSEVRRAPRNEDRGPDPARRRPLAGAERGPAGGRRLRRLAEFDGWWLVAGRLADRCRLSGHWCRDAARRRRYRPERRVLPPGARVRLVKAAAIAPGATLDGEEIGRLEGTLSFDNMEGSMPGADRPAKPWSTCCQTTITRFSSVLC